MTSTSKSSLKRGAQALFQFIDISRRVFLNVLFVGVCLAVFIAPCIGGAPDVEDGVALVLKPSGVLVEQLGVEPMAQVRAQLLEENDSQTLLRELQRAIDAAKDDKRIKIVVLDLHLLAGGGLPQLQALATSLQAFRASGKKVIALADDLNQQHYLLASAADEILLDPMGSVFFAGLGAYRNYYKDALDKIDADAHVFRVGEYKSAVEPFVRNNMSDEARADLLAFMQDMWREYCDIVSAARKLDAQFIDNYVTDYGKRLSDYNGDAAKLALDSGLVDKLANRVESRQYIASLVGEDAQTHALRSIDWRDYLAALGPPLPAFGNSVGVIVASGTILDGEQPPGTIGSDSLAKLITQARDDDNIKAIVLRVDSPGGSAFASEVIRVELQKCRDQGKPVVVSMASVAASGGYWIATASDEIWASPATMTGSIGIFGILLNFARSLSELGVHNDGVATSPYAGGMRPDRALSPEFADLLQQMINKGYADFLARVAAARNLSVADVDAIAQGRIWSGADALEHKLVDKLGGLPEAIAAAAERAHLGADFDTVYVEKELKFYERIMVELMQDVAHVVGPVTGAAPTLPASLPFIRQMLDEVTLLGTLNDPHGVYALCPYTPQW